MRALIADDDPTTRVILAKTLEKWGIQVVVACDGRSAWEALASGTGPSLAIVDWVMPGLDGLELCQRIRRETHLAHMYVLLLTARDRKADLVAGLDAGADDYIVKPFYQEELRARLHVGLRVLALQERMAERVIELQAARDELARVASTDALTGLCSRRRWFELADHEIARFRRYQRPFGVLMADLDHFKRVNDTFGHEMGDKVLVRFADVLRQHCRESDVIGRLGGEEFVALLPEATMEMTCGVAERIVEACRTVAIPTEMVLVTTTCSIGVAEASPTDEVIGEILRRSDAALYQAKQHGRNRVEAERAGLPEPSSERELSTQV